MYELTFDAILQQNSETNMVCDLKGRLLKGPSWVLNITSPHKHYMYYYSTITLIVSTTWFRLDKIVRSPHYQEYYFLVPKLHLLFVKIPTQSGLW